ncbi:42308_t:CDS:2, partial [Gigaspora margarita]
MQLITRPAHSIINQSFDSRLRLDTVPVNGWYQSNPDTTSTPCIFTSITPAWNNQNLSRLAEEIQSSLVFAHVRASTTGALSETNYELFLFVQGNTDSEWAFALFLNQLEDPINSQFDHETLKIAMLKTINQLNNWAEEAEIHETKADKREDIVLVASEPLTFEKADWLTIPTNTCLVITPKLNVLLFPIKDQFYNIHR